MKKSLLVTGLFGLCTVLAHADWPGFRGPGGDGHAAHRALPRSWSDSGGLLWKQPVPGEGWSSPVVSKGRIFITAAVKVPREGAEDYSLRLLAFDGDSGKPQFDVEVFEEDGKNLVPIHGKNSHASPTPLVAGDQVFVHFGHEGTACLDRNGKLIWQNRSLRYPPRHGAGGTPILVADALIFSCDGDTDPFIAALDRQTGKLLWKTARGTDSDKKFSFATATVIQVGEQQQVISPGSNLVNALDPKTGQELWRVRYDGFSVIPKPVYGNGLVYVCTGYGTPSLIAIRPDGQGDVTKTHVAWTVTRAVPHTPSLLLAGDLLFMVSDGGVASCLDAISGKTHWQERLGGNYSASPVLAKDSVYFLSESGTTTIVKAAKEFEKVAENSISERTLASFGVLGDSLLLRGDKHLYRIGAVTP